MNWIIQNVALFSLIIAFINIIVTLRNWYLRHPRLIFYKDDRKNFYYKSGKDERCYIGSKNVAFFYLKIANRSDLPCTISEFSMTADGYQPIYYRSNTKLLDKYYLYHSKYNYQNVRDVYVSDSQIIKLPCTIPPLGYVEGHAVFPYAPDFGDKELFVKITAKTARKNFTTYGFISTYTEDDLHTLPSDS